MNFNAVLVTLNLAKSAVTGIGIPGVEGAINGVVELASMVSVRDNTGKRHVSEYA
jgi:hypothetical protein